DRAVEKHVAHNGESRLRVEEHDMPRCVARRVEDLELVSGNGNLVALVQPAVRRHVAHAFGKAVFQAGRRQIVEQEFVILVRADNVHIQRFLEIERSPGVIDMAMRDPDGLDLDPLGSNRIQDAVEVTARIDHHALLGLAVEQYGADLLERRDGNDDGLQLPDWYYSTLYRVTNN